jgi:hypothetical protein
MAQAFTEVLLSGGTNGKNIKVVATATAGTLIHTAVAGVSHMDKIWLYAINNHTQDVDLTIEFGGVAVPDDLFKVSLKAYQGLTLIIPGLLLQNSLIVRAFASVANVVCINGEVHRVTVS